MVRSLLRCSLPAAALLLVAAPLRADTLKVPADFETIQAAIDVAGIGDVIQVSKGVYAENVVIDKSDITLKGKSATINGRYLGNCITVTGDNVTVESLTLVNGGGEPPGDGNSIGGIFANGTGISLSKLVVRACDEWGIVILGSEAVVEQCTVDACPGDGITVETDAFDGPTPSVVSKNKVTRCGGNGIWLADGPFTADKNSAEQNGGAGIRVEIPEPPADGATVVPTTVTKNTVRNNAGAGLYLFQGVASAGSIVAEKNKSESNGSGAELGGFLITFEGNTVQDNIEGGVIVEASDCHLSKNKIKGNGFGGVLVDAFTTSNGGAQGLNVLHQNTIQDNGGDGITIVSSNNEVHDCTIKGNVGDGIDIDEGADGNSIEGNKVSDSEHDGIDNSGLLTVIAGNNSKNNGGADIAGAGDGGGTVADADSIGNVVSDDSDIETFATPGELDLDVL